jgi:hypothetical protein
MKASKKMLLITMGLMIAGVVTGITMMRNHATWWLRKTAAESKFKPVAVEAFESLDFSNYWTADIRQGKEYKVELATGDNTRLKPRLETIDGTLYFKIDTINGSGNSENIQAKITLPSLLAIKTMHGTKILLRDFQADSLQLILEDGSAFTGYNNQFKYVSFKTSGAVSLQLITDE